MSFLDPERIDPPRAEAFTPSDLDAEAAERIETLLADVMDAYSLTAVLVTHDADRARRLGSRGVRLENGRPVRTGAIGTVVGE